MTKKINIFVKGKYGVGKTTFINCLRDILKKNKKFKELFDGYEFNIHEFAEDENKETQSAVTKKWIILDSKFEEEECLSIAYKKSFLGNIWALIVKIFKAIIKLFIR